MNALKWLCSGGGGHEDGEAMTCAALLLEAASDEKVIPLAICILVFIALCTGIILVELAGIKKLLEKK